MDNDQLAPTLKVQCIISTRQMQTTLTALTKPPHMSIIHALLKCDLQTNSTIDSIKKIQMSAVK